MNQQDDFKAVDNLNESVLLNDPISESINVSVVEEVPEEFEMTKNTTIQFSEMTPRNSTAKFPSNTRGKDHIDEINNRFYNVILKNTNNQIEIEDSHSSIEEEKLREGP
jgi:hypothetical protein